MLVNINERIRFIRGIDMESVGRDSTQKEHRAIIDALAARAAAEAEGLLTDHITLRREQIVEVIQLGLARIYLPAEEA